MNKDELLDPIKLKLLSDEKKISDCVLCIKNYRYVRDFFQKNRRNKRLARNKTKTYRREKEDKKILGVSNVRYV